MRNNTNQAAKKVATTISTCDVRTGDVTTFEVALGALAVSRTGIVLTLLT